MSKIKLSEAAKDIEFDVIIVGAGMVGLSMALMLSRAMEADSGFKIALVDAQQVAINAEQKPTDINKIKQFDVRVSALTVKSQDIMDALGIWQTHIVPHACPYQDMFVWDSEGTGNISFSALDLHQAALGYIVENSIITEALNSALEHHKNISQFRGEQVSSFIQEQVTDQEQRNVLSLTNGLELQAKLLIAADGANSFIRQQADFKLREWSYEQQAIVTTVRSEKSHDFTASQCFLPSGPLAFLPLHDSENDREAQHYSSIVWSCDPDKAKFLMGVDDAAFQLALQQAFENRLGTINEIGKRMSFPLWQRHPTAYIKPGLALIGDAAHSIHPLAGQGVNMGLLDVESLSEVIRAAISKGENFSSEQVLSRYQRQRKAHNLSMMSLMEAFKRGFSSNDLTLRWLRNIGLDAVNKAIPLKRQLMKKAMGI